MPAPRPALRVTIAIFSAYVLVLQLLLAGLAGGAVAGTADGALCAASGGGEAPGHRLSGGDCCVGASIVVDGLEGPAAPAARLPESRVVPIRHGGDGAAAGVMRPRLPPPSRRNLRPQGGPHLDRFPASWNRGTDRGL